MSKTPIEEILAQFEHLEHRLILGTLRPEKDDLLHDILSPLVSGDFKQVLLSGDARSLFGTDENAEGLGIAELEKTLDVGKYVATRLAHYLEPMLEKDSESSSKLQNVVEREYKVLAVGLALLYSFIQTGWTGPLLDIDPIELLPACVRSRKDELNKHALKSMSADGEDVYHLTPKPLFLLLAKAILTEGTERLKHVHTVAWWRYRCIFLQQRILEEHAASLQADMLLQLDHTQKYIDSKGSFESEEIKTELLARLELEYGLVLQWYTQTEPSVERFRQAQKHSGLEWELSGALGKRTKFQVFDVSQLVLLAESRSDGQGERKNDGKSAAEKLPDTLPLNDDTLLERIAFTKSKPSLNSEDEKQGDENSLSDRIDPGNQPKLAIFDQCLLLAYCLNVKNTNPHHGLTMEQMIPFVVRVLENPNNWMVHTMALLLRSRLEANKTRTVERSALQLQALVDQIPLEESKVKERVQFFFQLLLPAKWEMEGELAQRFMSLGVVKSALEIFQRLEMWDEIVACHVMLEKPEKAKAVVEERMRVEPDSPKLYCLLGDLEKNPEHYEKAWEISGKRYARAMRSLGGHYFKQQEFKRSVECYRLALAINPLIESSWFVMGCAAMQIPTPDWETAIESFTRCVSLDHTNGEAWNNLASIYLKSGRKQDAVRPLQQALRQSYDDWRIWQNYLYTCVDVGEFGEVIRATERLMELRWEKDGSKAVDVEVLGILVDAVTRGTSDASGREASYLSNRVDRLLREVITPKITSSAAIWRVYAKFFMGRGEWSRALDGHLKAYRCIAHDPKLETDEQVFKDIAHAALELVDAYENLGQRTEKNANGEERVVCGEWKRQAQMALKTLLGRSKTSWEDTDTYETIQDRLKELKTL
ncbi:uncharacterized protein VTP21DRAFT_3261 [Calcarisporiella thermophila]|uniref:uncharacterized protein n=1 Tax=Calcarisporiella thermophila TaxID=911321 RepID=UPI003744416E